MSFRSWKRNFAAFWVSSRNIQEDKANFAEKHCLKAQKVGGDYGLANFYHFRPSYARNFATHRPLLLYASHLQRRR